MTDPHDPRTFQHYVKLAPDGTILAMTELVITAPPPEGYVIVTPALMAQWSQAVK